MEIVESLRLSGWRCLGEDKLPWGMLIEGISRCVLESVDGNFM